MDDCVFCKIIKGEIPSSKVYEDELCYAINDIAPQAKVHVLVMPKEHVQDLTHAAQNTALTGHLLKVCAILAEQLGLADGYRVITNIGRNGCQSVQHLHFHILGGEQLGDKMS